MANTMKKATKPATKVEVETTEEIVETPKVVKEEKKKEPKKYEEKNLKKYKEKRD